MKVRFGPDGLHLFDRQTGLNVLIDEVELEERSWSRGPRQVSMALTNACDLDCRYCYAPKQHATLARDRVLSWIGELDKAGTLGVGFGGGEPTLYRHLPEVCTHAAERTDLAVTITTNGLRWNADLISRLRGAVHFVRVSVDGVESTYERLRGRRFSQLRAAIDAIAADFRWGVNTVVNRDTIVDLTAIAALAEEQGASELLLLPQRATSAAERADEESLRALRHWVREYDGPLTLATSTDSEMGGPIAEALPMEVGTRSYAHIDAAGTARSSSYSGLGVQIDDTGVLAALGKLEQMEDG